MVWLQNPTLPRLRRPAVPEQPQEGRGPSGSPRPAPGRPVPRSGESRRATLTETILSDGKKPKTVQMRPACKAKRAGFANVRHIAPLAKDF